MPYIKKHAVTHPASETVFLSPVLVRDGVFHSLSRRKIEARIPAAARLSGFKT